jgi:hypothetical protein
MMVMILTNSDVMYWLKVPGSWTVYSVDQIRGREREVFSMFEVKILVFLQNV